MRLNLGCGLWGTLTNPWPPDAPPNYDFGGPLPGWVNVDLHVPPNLTPEHNFVQHDLNSYPWPFADGQFEEVRAYHILEHLAGLTAAMREIHRVALDGATVDIVVPYAGSVWEWSNPHHCCSFNHRTFEHYCRGIGDTNDLDFAFRGFAMVRQSLREVGHEEFEGVRWLLANLQVVLKALK